MRLTGKVALITGAASGLGAATAKRFVEEGAKICIGDVLETDAKAVAESLSGNALFHRLDVSDEGSWKGAVEATIEKFGRLDILVNNAGIGPGTTDHFDEAAWERLIAVNMKGTFLGIKTVAHLMQSQGGGAIINISSITAKSGSNLHLGYGGSKGAVIAMSKSAAIQFAANNVRVNAVLPGVMPPMRNSKLDSSARQRLLDAIPMGRVGDVDDIANAVLFLASDEAKYITGVELPVDGGFLSR